MANQFRPQKIAYKALNTKPLRIISYCLSPLWNALNILRVYIGLWSPPTVLKLVWENFIIYKVRSYHICVVTMHHFLLYNYDIAFVNFLNKTISLSSFKYCINSCSVIYWVALAPGWMWNAMKWSDIYFNSEKIDTTISHKLLDKESYLTISIVLLAFTLLKLETSYRSSWVFFLRKLDLNIKNQYLRKQFWFLSPSNTFDLH